MLAELTIDDFSKCLNQAFRIHAPGREPVATELVEVRGLVPPDDDPDRRQPFSLIFEGPLDAPLEQATYNLENETLGELGVFVVTLGPYKEKMRHEVVFT